MVKKKVQLATSLQLESVDMKKYTKLLGKVDYDHEAAEQLADALNEIDGLKLRQAQLEQMVNENNELHQFVWRSSGKGVIALHNIDDDHLGNIMLHLIRGGRAIPRAVRGEAVQRGMVIPARVSVDWDDDLADRYAEIFNRRDI